ncbi:hypothetical protein Ppa06_17280 [Planomonospora parontospora subsp. parontospora]|uniref:Glycosyltransferase RgtA/B/C/D-like domain-containing protein n=2 Tax=Planomonospora parontospora TaxID=58119 RepID=A0AA37BE72_9ACTN|nr:hypothetical protein [Planomonospora parontospora]GGK58640.1 hypothetical protein GCM10010126_17840 [Planomonospora parontospora]GII07930.1 hypothetical protein Ppa06_17280 [Planomonospora parontospora subsp. parontospora]
MRTTWPERVRRPSAGRVLAVASAAPALVLAGWLLAGLPLLLLGWFRPPAAVPLGLAAAALLCQYGLRRPPGSGPGSRAASRAGVTPGSASGSGSGPGRASGIEGATRWQVAGVLAVAAGSGVLNALLHSEQLVVRRDPATYAQYAVWLATRGALPIPYGEAAFGGPDAALRFDSVGFFDHGGAVVPQFMPGPPMLYAIGHWLGGLPGLLLTPPVLGALAVLVFAGTAARLAGARWAPLAALALAVCLPVLYTSRTTFSEIPSLILLFGGLSLLLDARSRLGAASAGLVFGLAVLVRIDGLRDVLPVLAYAGLLIALRRAGAPGGRLGPPLLGGLLAGAGLGFAAAFLLAEPYLAYLEASWKPLLAVCGAVLLLTLAAAALAPRLAGPFRRAARVRWLPEAAAGLVAAVMAAFAVRPWLQTVTREAVTREDRTTAEFIEKTQAANGLAVDGTRLYYEDSLHWAAWYVGVPAVLLATLAAAVLARRLVRGRAGGWLLPLAVIGWTTVTTLYRPAITPDHPWAARRLVPVVLPGLILLAVWGLKRILRAVRERGHGPGARRGAAVLGAVLLVAPAAVTSIGTAFTPVGRGERAAVEALCASLPPEASALIVERVTADRFTQLVRGVCGVPAARAEVVPGTDLPSPADVTRLIGRIRAAGRTPVLLAAEAGQLAPYGTPVRVMALRTRQDERSLTEAPNGTWSLSVDVWTAVP